MILDREDLLEAVDTLLADYLLAPEEMDYHHLCELNELFDGTYGPTVFFCTLEKENGQLTAEVWVPADEDPDEWVAAVDVYLGGRISVEPYESRPLPPLSFLLNADATAAKDALRGVYDTLTEALEAYSRPTRSGWVGTKAVTKKPKAKPAGKPVPHYVALNQKRGSKGKRKAW